MANRSAMVAQADIARIIRACRKAGLPISRIVHRGDRVEVETTQNDGDASIITVAPGKEIVL